jgi:hypothetical protein
MFGDIKKPFFSLIRSFLLSRFKISLKNRFNHQFVFELMGPDGQLKWRVVENNLVVNTGLDDILDKYWRGSNYSASHFVGLTDGTPTVDAADTMASHAGWAEVTAYSNATRPALTLGAVSGQSVDNSAAKASFNINADSTTIGGAFVCTNNTKGGTSGVLIGAVAFTGGDKSADNGDTLNVTVILTASSS